MLNRPTTDITSPSVRAVAVVRPEDLADLPRAADRQLTLGADVPDGVAIYRINGPFFFGAAWR